MCRVLATLPSICCRKERSSWCRWRCFHPRQWQQPGQRTRLSCHDGPHPWVNPFTEPSPNGSMGRVRSRAWICLFPSTQRTTAWSGGPRYGPTGRTGPSSPAAYWRLRDRPKRLTLHPPGARLGAKGRGAPLAAAPEPASSRARGHTHPRGGQGAGELPPAATIDIALHRLLTPAVLHPTRKGAASSSQTASVMGGCLLPRSRSSMGSQPSSQAGSDSPVSSVMA